MITHPESSAYRPALAHSSSSSTPDQWARSSVGPSAIPNPREPAPSARGAPLPSQQSALRHHSTSSRSTPPPSTSTPIPFDHAGATTSHPPSGNLGTFSPSSSVSATPDSYASPTRTKRASEDTPPIQLRNLNHIVELAKEDCLHPQPTHRRNRSGNEDKRRYEISSMPVGDVIEMVAALLTKITTTNDLQHEHLHRNMPPDGVAGLSTTTNSVLAFHGKNVPSITIQSYLSRIHKYCPTTYEVFLSLLVYFDRMTERVNEKPLAYGVGGSVTIGDNHPDMPPPPAPSAPDPYHTSHVFVVDSYNIHRLVIAGVTCASKFFSDVFYTNSRYAKVGGLPLAELNHLELQFLILNDFRLSVPVEELEAYGTMLVQFYAREAIANANLQGIDPPSPPAQQQQQQQQPYVVGSIATA
ncbi:cyclin-domain-containing protein [Tricharina praecox]|uniref:cyclin-domain-containing protein n=1 Tax=Tricharina praecox TaxID=43433 RepID=UPI00222081E9|nr:cyclin-domain-containing protein [Tricharina praecox]KAI5857743.1 cyclin-domain-containing protein [Tricharina praecox]